MVADLFNIYHTHQNESIEIASEMHTSTHPSHHLYQVWLACVRDMAFYVCLDLCSHHFLPLVSNTGAGNALLRTYVCVSMFCCLAIRSLVAFMCLLLFFPHILAFFHRRAHTEERSRSLSSVCITSCPPHFAHSLENWVQHDLFTIRKYVL